MPLSLTTKERKALAVLLALVALGLFGLATLDDEGPSAPPGADSGFARPVPDAFPASAP